MTLLAFILLATPVAILVFMAATFVGMIAPRRTGAVGTMPPRASMPPPSSIPPPPMPRSQGATAQAPSKLRNRHTLAMRRQLKSTGTCDWRTACQEHRAGRQEQRRSERPGPRTRRPSVRVFRPIGSA